MDDLTLLRTYEPIVKYTQGELFFPCAVDEYVKRCSLWERSLKSLPKLIVPVGELTLDKLAQYDKIQPDHTLYLQFVPEPLTGIEYRRWLRRKDRSRFNAPGRLSRVGLLSRIADSAFDLSLWLRGTVPGGTVAAAEIEYRKILATTNNQYNYYGRVIHEGGYIILHYVFFYVMNNWRSTFYGVNDHEADWEQVFIYLEDRADKQPKPTWVAYAAHDYYGDDLRRHWDDPELNRDGTHPIIFAGAGSHASYFQRGEYLTNIELNFLKPIGNIIRASRRFWSEFLRQGNANSEEDQKQIGLLSLPFIDYARGDGLSIGIGQEANWSPIIISDELKWNENYRGLWGFDAKDPLKGETAPSGPKYNRDGTIRQSWHNPLGWAGLHKVPPSHYILKMLEETITDLNQQLVETDEQIYEAREELIKTGLQAQAFRQSEHLDVLLNQQQTILDNHEISLNYLYNRKAEIADTIKANQNYLLELRAGKSTNLQDHIKHKHRPQSELQVIRSRLIDFWAAISTGLLLISFASIIYIHPTALLPSLAFMISTFILIEAILRRNLQTLLLNITLILAVFTTLILIYEGFVLILLIAIVGISLSIILGNLRELREH